MSTDITVILSNKPGTLADLGECLGNAGVNIDGTFGIPCEGKGEIHILVADAAAAKTALVDGGFEIAGEQEVLLLDIVDQPGEFGRIARKIADAGVNITMNYVTVGGQLVVGADDLDGARGALA